MKQMERWLLEVKERCIGLYGIHDFPLLRATADHSNEGGVRDFIYETLYRDGKLGTTGSFERTLTSKEAYEKAFDKMIRYARLIAFQ